MRAWLQRNFLTAELWAAIVIAFAFTTALHLDRSLMDSLPPDRSALYSTLASIFGSLLGFVIAAIAIVLTLAPDSRLEIVTTSPHYKVLWRIFFSATRALGIATAACVVGVMTDRGSRPNLVFFGIVLFSSLWSSLRVWRCIWVLERIVGVVIKRAAKEASQES